MKATFHDLLGVATDLVESHTNQGLAQEELLVNCLFCTSSTYAAAAEPKVCLQSYTYYFARNKHKHRLSLNTQLQSEMPSLRFCSYIFNAECFHDIHPKATRE